MKFIARFYRYNPQHRYVGYDVVREIEAESFDDAKKKAKDIEDRVDTGTLELLSIKEKED